MKVTSNLACRGKLLAMIFIIALSCVNQGAHAHPLDLAVLTLQENAVDPRRFKMQFQLNTNAIIPISELVRIPRSCHPHDTRIDIKNSNEFRYHQMVHCPQPGLANKRFSFRKLPEGTNVMIRALRGDEVLFEGLLPSGSDRWVLPSGPQSAAHTLLSYGSLGIEHIMIGADHLLFIALLLMIAPWGKRLLLLVTAFTAGHSLTLALATFGVIKLGGPLVELFIAMSIVFLAAEVIRHHSNKQSTLTYRYPGIVTLLFGSIHGLGFAAVLSGLEVSQDNLLWSLAGFNLGVEIGQLGFIVALLITIQLFKSRQFPGWLVTQKPWAYLAGSLGAFWFFLRLASL